MSRTVPSALQAHLDSGATTMALIMRIEPVMPGFSPVGCTTLDRDIVYDDGRGELTYHAVVGYTPSSLQATASMGVDNSEGQHLLPMVDMGIDEKELASGAWDYANFWIMWVNYEDLSMGHVAITRGQLGQVRIENGITFWTEPTSLVKQLKVPIVKKSSRLCRAIFGSQYPGTPGAEVLEIQPCTRDFTDLWVGGTVSAVGLENSRTFTASGLSGNFFPGMVKWLTGDNAGQQIDVETQTTTTTISLAKDCIYPIQIGDTFQIRPDCTKWKDGVNGCKQHHGDQWVFWYRGEPHLKPQDSDSALTPGAAIGPGVA